MADQRDKIFQFILTKGPVIPMDIVKFINSDTLIASAYLSQLVSENKLMVSSLKFGGSPLYYAKGQEEKLLNYLGRLKAPEQKAIELLKVNKVIKDHDLDLLNRVALRNAKDFAIPLQITTEKDSEIYWKFYLTTDEEARELIKLGLEPFKEEAKSEIKPTEVKPIVVEAPKPAAEEKTKPTVEEKPKVAVSKDEPRPIFARTEEKKPMQETLSSQTKPTKKMQEKKTEEKKPEEKKMQEKKPELVEQKEAKALPSKIIPSHVESLAINSAPQFADQFYQKIKNYFDKEDIIIKESKLIRKESDFELTILVPSPIGRIEFFCKAKDKKKITDGDLSSAFVQGQMKKLPVLFLTTGELAKKGQEMLGKEFSNMKVSKI